MAGYTTTADRAHDPLSISIYDHGLQWETSMQGLQRVCCSEWPTRNDSKMLLKATLTAGRVSL